MLLAVRRAVISGSFCDLALEFAGGDQQNGEHGAVIGWRGSRLDLDVAAVTFRDFFGHPQPQACADIFLGGEKRLEDLIQVMLCYPGAVVFNS